MSAYSSFEKINGKKFIIDLAINLNYSEDLMLILEKDEKKLINKFPDTYNNLINCRHQRDSRSYLDYGRDLITSWLLEDYFLDELRKLGLKINLVGNDKERKILKNSKTSTNSDYEVIFENNTIKVELVFDFTDFCLKNKKIDLRDNKIDKILDSKSLLLGYIIKSNKFFLLNPSKMKKNKIIKIDFHPIYRKPATSILLDNEDFKNFSFDEIIKNFNNQ
jgi:hypothetical protein